MWAVFFYRLQVAPLIFMFVANKFVQLFTLFFFQLFIKLKWTFLAHAFVKIFYVSSLDDVS